MPPPMPPARKYPEVLLSPQVRYQPVYNGMFTSTAFAWTTIFNVETRANRVRAVVHNHTASTVPLDSVLISATSTAASNAWDPHNAAGTIDKTMWQKITWNNNGADVASMDQAPITTPVYTFTLPVGTTGQPSLSYSDWIDIAPLDRVDGGAGFLLMTRALSTGALPLQSMGNGAATSPALGRVVTAYNSGNASAMASPYTSNGNNLPASASWPLALDIIGDGFGATIMVAGDSIHALGADGYAGCYGHRAAIAVSSPARSVTFESNAYPGRQSVDYLALALARVRSAFPPHIVVLPCWSRNDPFTQASADYTFRQSLAFAAECRKRGISVVLTTAAPAFDARVSGYNSGTWPAQETYRRGNNAKVRQCGLNGWPVLDLDALWGDPTASGGALTAYKTGLNHTDFVHPSQDAHALAAATLAPLLRRALALA